MKIEEFIELQENLKKLIDKYYYKNIMKLLELIEPIGNGKTQKHEFVSEVEVQKKKHTGGRSKRYSEKDKSRVINKEKIDNDFAKEFKVNIKSIKVYRRKWIKERKELCSHCHLRKSKEGELCESCTKEFIEE